MKPLLLTLFGALLFSCSSSTTQKTPEELNQLFTDYMLQQHPELSNGKHIVFLVNKVDCSPCIEAIETIMHADYPARKEAVLFEYQRLDLKTDVKLLNEHPKNIARYGMLTGDGKICVFKNGKLTVVTVINVENPQETIKELKLAVSSSN